MAANPGVKPRKTRNGWNIVEEPVTPEPIVEVATQPSKTGLVLDWTELREKLYDNPCLRWESSLPLPKDKRREILEALLTPRTVTTETVLELLNVTKRRDELGYSIGMSFPLIVRAATDYLTERGMKTEPDTSPEDGFIPGFVDPDVAIARVSLAGITVDTPTIRDPERILQIALGEKIPLDERTVDQLWLTLAYAWVQRWNRTLPPLARKIQTSILHYANPRHIPISTAACFSFADEIAFRS